MNALLRKRRNGGVDSDSEEVSLAQLGEDDFQDYLDEVVEGKGKSPAGRKSCFPVIGSAIRADIRAGPREPTAPVRSKTTPVSKYERKSEMADLGRSLGLMAEMMARKMATEEQMSAAGPSNISAPRLEMIEEQVNIIISYIIGSDMVIN